MQAMELSFENAARLNKEFEKADAGEVLLWAASTFGRDAAFACSFGAEDVVLLDIIAKTARDLTVFVLDTGRLHQQTYDVMDRCRERYRLDFEIYFPETRAVQGLIRLKGPNSFYQSVDNRKECCEIRKVEPLLRALEGKHAWITGLRRDQAVTRVDLPKIEMDFSHGGIFKLNPLAGWSEEQIWDYIRANNVPYNELHDAGFPSIGCAPCTRAIKLGENVRAGRWWWEDPEQKECGLHVKLSA